jgi:cytoskeletal protein CcmA (bactofilin family)
VFASNVKVDGSFQGNCDANNEVTINKGAKVKGNFHASKLIISDGAAFDGRCKVGKFSGSFKKAA